MTRNVILNNIDHADLRVAIRHGSQFGDSVNQVAVFPTEFADVARCYPIFLRRDADGQWQTVALLGLDRDENLFLEGERWNATYIPAVQRRGPFLIGMQTSGADQPPHPVILVDLEDPRVSINGAAGEPVFRPHGGNTPFLDSISHVLRALHQGVEVAPSLFAAWEAHGLVEPITVEVKLDSGDQYHLPELYTVSEERLVTLAGQALEELNRAGYLGAAFIVAASTANVQRLIERKSQRAARQSQSA